METYFPVIIDNMMNLELLFWAAAETGNATLKDIAVTHARTTQEHHVRPDGSTFHVVDYDNRTGGVLHSCTAQGYRYHPFPLGKIPRLLAGLLLLLLPLCRANH